MRYLPKRPQEKSAAKMYRELISQKKKLSDKDIYARVLAAHPNTKDLVMWYRWQLATHEAPK
jgi:hypothetical protein